jgi:glycosyltransferase involved in cell wall biosynthesis
MPADQPLAPDAARPAVCFITVEFHGLFRNGGIGTANTALALALAAEGFAVTVAIANADAAGPRLEIGDFATLKAHYAGLGICLDYVPPGAGLPRAFNDPALASWSVYEYLKSQNFDVVLFNDNGGQGYYTLLAKRMGVFAPAPHLVVVAHGPVDWVSELNAQEYFYMGLQTCFMEAQSAALADTLVSPSRYLLDWMSARGWVTPGQGLVVQNLVGAAPRPMPHIMHPVSELVFFGRQEIRKGIDLFCDALDELTVQGVDLTNVRVTFLGKFSMAGPLHSGVYIGERARQWRTQLRILTEYGQEEALAYLRAPGRLAVIPSRAENSPCVVAECLLQGILFLATDRGGTAELVAVEDREQCLFTPAPGDLAMRLAGCLAHGQRPGRLAVSQADVLAQWRALLRAMPGRTTSAAPEEHPATISVCLAGDTSPAFADCLAALQAQDVAPLEILVAPLVSMQAPAGTVLVPGLYPSRAAARNAAAAQARGSHLFFIEEQYATLAPEGIAVLLNAARGGADILTCMRAPEIDSQGGMPVLPLGGCLERGLMVNCFGDGAFAVRRASFGQGLPEDGPDRAAAWRFFIRNVATEAALALVPAPLLQWRYAHEMDDGAALVEERRCLVNDLADLPLRHVGRLLECAMQITQRRQTWLDTLAENFSGPAAEAVRQLRRVAPNSGQARKFFMTYCEGVGHAALALDYAAQNDPALIRSLVRPPTAPPPKAVAPPPPKAAMASPAPVPPAVSAPPKAALPPAPPIQSRRATAARARVRARARARQNCADAERGCQQAVTVADGAIGAGRCAYR